MDQSSGSKTKIVPDVNQRQAGKAKTRRAIMKAAGQLFSKNGIDQTHAEEIARKAGVGVGTIYLHFGDKDGLLREILLEAADELDASIQQIYQDPAASPLAGAYAETIARYIEAHGRMAGLVLGLMLSGQAAAKAMLERAVGQMEQHILDGQEKGIYRRDVNPRLAARAEVHRNLGLLAWWADDPRRASREEIVGTLANLRSSGLQTQTPQGNIDG